MLGSRKLSMLSGRALRSVHGTYKAKVLRVYDSIGSVERRFLVTLQKGENCCIQLGGKLRDRQGGRVLEWLVNELEQKG